MPWGAGLTRKTASSRWRLQISRQKFRDMVVMTDVCLCEYTDHGHCGIIKNGKVDNDSTLELLARQALSHAYAGADFVGPSDMMDGRVAAIRTAWMREVSTTRAFCPYAVKYASAFLWPLPEAAESAPQFGDRAGYQMDPCERFGSHEGKPGSMWKKERT